MSPDWRDRILAILQISDTIIVTTQSIRHFPSNENSVALLLLSLIIESLDSISAVYEELSLRTYGFNLKRSLCSSDINVSVAYLSISG